MGGRSPGRTSQPVDSGRVEVSYGGGSGVWENEVGWNSEEE